MNIMNVLLASLIGLGVLLAGLGFGYLMLRASRLEVALDEETKEMAMGVNTISGRLPTREQQKVTDSLVRVCLGIDDF